MFLFRILPRHHSGKSPCPSSLRGTQARLEQGPGDPSPSPSPLYALLEPLTLPASLPGGSSREHHHLNPKLNPKSQTELKAQCHQCLTIGFQGGGIYPGESSSPLCSLWQKERVSGTEWGTPAFQGLSPCVTSQVCCEGFVCPWGHLKIPDCASACFQLVPWCPWDSSPLTLPRGLEFIRASKERRAERNLPGAFTENGSHKSCSKSTSQFPSPSNGLKNLFLI